MKYTLSLPNAKCPTKHHENDACWDLYTSCNFILSSHTIQTINTGFACQLPVGYDALIKERSKLGSRGLMVIGGVIDNGYTGTWGVTLYNAGSHALVFYIGDKIAQFMLVKKTESIEFELVDKLEETERGEKGIWSQ